MLVAELRRDLAFSEMQHSIGQIYASVGKDILPANHENLSVDDLSNNIEISLMEWGETYQAVVNLPLDQQDPQDFDDPRHYFPRHTRKKPSANQKQAARGKSF